MKKILNRFAWFIAMSAGIGIGILFGFHLIVGIIFGLIIKKLFFSKKFINSRLEFFVNQIKQNYIGIKKEVPVLEVEKGNIRTSTDEKKVLDTKIKVEEKEYIEPKYSKPTKINLLITKFGKYITNFFTTNTIAKIGALILFFVIIYFLKGFAASFWDIIGPIGRLILGFIISIIIFGFGIKLEKTDAKQEGMILIGLSILLNYAIILSGRYLIGDNINGGDGFLTGGVTFVLLILNTVFGVLTSLVYNSRNLLLFSFIFAYLNPFIVGEVSDGTPYILIGYSLIISLGALFLANKQKSILLFGISFILGNILFLVAPVSDSIGALSKLIILNIFNIAAIYSIFNFDKKYNTIIEYLFAGVFAIIGIFYISVVHYFSVDFIFYIISIISSLLFLFISYFLSNKRALLYSIGTLGTVWTLGILVTNNIDFIGFNIGILAIFIFAISNWLMPFVNDKLLKKKNFNSLIIGSILGVGFIAFQIYNFGEEYFSGMIQGLAFLALAIVYFLHSYFITQKIGIEKMREDEDLKNIFYSFAGISISLFSIAVAFIFSDYPEIVSAIWLFEATILYYFYSKNSSIKVFIAATVLFVIGLSKFGILLDNVESGDYKFLISFVIILASFMLNLFFINKAKEKKESLNIIHSIGHLIGMGIMGGLLLQIIPSTGHGWSLFGITIFITVLGYFYARFSINFLKIVFIILIGLFGFLHIGELNSVFRKLERDELDYLKNLQYIVSAIFISNIIIWKQLNKVKSYNKIILILISIYAFIISNIYILDIFGNLLGHFSLTIYWGFIASILLFIGISKDIIKYRTIGLYFLGLTTAKIFLFDIWFGMDGDSRFMALGVLGVIFIVISTLYTKKYGNNILGELNIKNLKSKKKEQNYKNIEKNIEKNEEQKEEEIEIEEENSFMKKLKKIEIGEIKVVRFFPNKSENFTVRAKNLIRLVILISEKTGKTTFKSGELNSIYNFIIKNYKSDLSRREYDKIRTLIKDFIEVGGSIEIVKY